MHDLVCCRKWFFYQILLCKRGQRGNTWCSHAAFPGIGSPWVRFVQGGLCRGRFCEELPARHLTLLSLPGTACSPALSWPGGLLRQSQLTGYSAVFQQGCLIHLWGTLAGLPLLLVPEADESARDQRKGNPCSQRFPGPSDSTEPSPGDPPLCTLCHASATKNHLQSLEYF